MYRSSVVNSLSSILLSLLPALNDALNLLFILKDPLRVDFSGVKGQASVVAWNKGIFLHKNELKVLSEFEVLHRNLNNMIMIYEGFNCSQSCKDGGLVVEKLLF